MSAKLLSGKELSVKIKDELKIEVDKLKKEGVEPGLAVVIVGNNSASRIYVNSKKKMCEEIGIKSYEYALNDDCTEKELVDLVNKLNLDKKVNGILVQLPLPKQISEDIIINTIDPKKDVDGFHPESVGNLIIGKKGFVSCTPYGIMEMLKYYDVEVEGKDCVVIGRSNIVGKPISALLMHKNGTVTICHSRTKNLNDTVKRADIVVAAIGKANYVKKEMIKDGAVVIDVGINRLENKKVVGDVDFESVKEVAAAITPVPGGVGKMTIAMLMKNTVKAAVEQSEKV